MILYPTETIYALGVNALETQAVDVLFAFKGRTAGKSTSWLVRDISDIERYAEVSYVARLFIEQHLPGPLTLVLPARSEAEQYSREADKTLSFRISSDKNAKKLIAAYMEEHDAPLTCTSANVSGMEPAATPEEIMLQFQEAGRDISQLTDIIDGSKRKAAASTVVRVIGDDVTVLRKGNVSIDLPSVT